MAGSLAAAIVVAVIVISWISPELGSAAVAFLPLAGMDLNPLAMQVPDFAALAQLDGMLGQIGKFLFAIIAGGALGLGLEKSWNHLTGS